MERVLQLRRINKKRPMKAKKKPNIKVTYISNPMKVRANNESEFRSIVQELTGKNSTVDWPELEADHDDEFVMAAADGGADVAATPPPPADVEQGMIEIESSPPVFEYLHDDQTSHNSFLDNLYGFQYYWGVLA